jgi:TolA-binding protein
MTEERDLLSRVGRTLRERTDGRNTRSDETRERVLNSLRQKKKRRTWWFKGSIPGGMLLLGTTAWAQATHQWPAVWQTLGDILSLPLSSEGNSEQERVASVSSHGVGALQNPAPLAVSATDANTTNEEANTVTDITATLDEPGPATTTASNTDTPPTPERRKHPRRFPAKRVAPLVGSTPKTVEHETEPPSEPEIAAFRAANDLDVKQRNLGAALLAYRAYLATYPAGRFVPEARYNHAIILVKLGQRDEARRELTPFASGKYGAHRQERAARLLEALERTAP